MGELSLVSSDLIWEELKNRYDAVILCTLQNRDDRTEARQLSYAGGKFTCVGLAEFTRYKLLKDMDAEDR